VVLAAKRVSPWRIIWRGATYLLGVLLAGLMYPFVEIRDNRATIAAYLRRMIVPTAVAAVALLAFQFSQVVWRLWLQTEEPMGARYLFYLPFLLLWVPVLLPMPRFARLASFTPALAIWQLPLGSTVRLDGVTTLFLVFMALMAGAIWATAKPPEVRKLRPFETLVLSVLVLAISLGMEASTARGLQATQAEPIGQLFYSATRMREAPQVPYFALQHTLSRLNTHFRP
jgi:hypothetical protein